MEQTISIQEGNKLIAEFMGYYLFPSEYTWNDIMPVVEKCINSGGMFYTSKVYRRAMLSANINNVRQAVVQFIQWYNNQK